MIQSDNGKEFISIIYDKFSILTTKIFY